MRVESPSTGPWVRRLAGFCFVFLLLALASTGCKRDPESQELPLELPNHAETEAATSAASRDIAGDFSKLRTMRFDEFERAVAKVSGLDEHYIVNGDMGIVGRRNLEAYFRQIQNYANGVAGGKLLINRVGDLSGDPFAGKPDMWDPETRHSLNYCVSENSFKEFHGSVVEAMEKAANDWERYADVDFIHLKELDDNCNHEDHETLVFTVEQASLGGGALAMAPFPEDQKVSRIVRLGRDYLKSGDRSKYPLDGLLRHELGHVLGFDHEMLRPEAGACFHADNSFALTPYDTDSVMMYPECSTNNIILGARLSSNDQKGVACVYGPGPEGRVDAQLCAHRTALSAEGGKQVSVIGPDAVIAGNAWHHLDPLVVRPGSIVSIVLEQRTEGDADLYVRYAARPSSLEFDCAPRRELKKEICRLHVPEQRASNSRQTIYIGALGIVDSTIGISISYSPPADADDA